MRLGDFEIKWCCDFDILTIAIDESDFLAKSLHHRCIVGKHGSEGLMISTLEQLDVECLGSLHKSVFIARHRLAVVVFEMAYRLNHRNDRNDSPFGASRGIAAGNDIDGGEGAHTIVHYDHALGIVGNE